MPVTEVAQSLRPHLNRRVLIAGLAGIMLAVALSPGERIAWPLISWRVYTSPSAEPSPVTHPVLTIHPQDQSKPDTLYAADLFAVYQLRLSERVLVGAFKADSATAAAYRKVLQHVLGLQSGTVVRGLLFEMETGGHQLDVASRSRPARATSIGQFVVAEDFRD